jgi:hypothetical protein
MRLTKKPIDELAGIGLGKMCSNLTELPTLLVENLPIRPV